jgi:hypothetical protein
MMTFNLKPQISRLLMLGACVLTFNQVNAQSNKTWHLGFGITTGKPTQEPFKFSLGGDIRVQKDFNGHVSGTLTAGFTHWFEKDHFKGYNEYGSPYNVIPVKAGIKIFPAKNFYLGAEAGAGFGMEQWRTSFLWSPSLGYAFNNGIDISVKYEDYTRDKATKQVALRLAYALSPRIAVHQKTTTTRSLNFGVSANIGLAAEDFGGVVLGAQADLFKPLTHNLELVINGGYNHYSKNYYISTLSIDQNTYSYRYDTTATNVFPLKAGLRLYAGNKFYLAGEAGAAFSSQGTSFVYSPSIGLAFKNGIDAGLKYENYSQVYIERQLAFRIGYRFK